MQLVIIGTCRHPKAVSATRMGAFRHGLRPHHSDGSKRSLTSRATVYDEPTAGALNPRRPTPEATGRTGRLMVPETRISCRSTSPRPIDYIRQPAMALLRAATGGDAWQRFEEGLQHQIPHGVSPSILRMRITSSFRQPPPRDTPTLAGGIVISSRRTAGSPWQQVRDGLPEPAGRRTAFWSAMQGSRE